MFSRKLFVAFLTLALTSFTAQAAPAFKDLPSIQNPVCDNNNNNVRTVTRTVTVTAAPPAKTSSRGNITVTRPNNNGNNNNNGGGRTNTNTNTNGGKTNTNTNTNTKNNGGNNNTNTGGGKTNTNTNTNTNTKNNGGNNNTNTGGGKTNTGGNNNNTGGGKTNTGGNNNNTGGAGGNNGDPQKSLTLDPKVIASGFANDGQDIPTDGQVASLTSTNNFINFCLTVPNLPITNGKQISTGSCNPAPIGVIPSTDNMPSSKFTFPTNFGAVKTDTAFTIKMQIKNMQTGFFVNAQENYFSAPQFLNGQGQIQGHSHVVVEQLSSFDQTTATDPKKFAFFKGLNAAAVGGLLTADVTAGLPAGAYKLSSINSAANHQPVIVPVAQHGSLDDAIYFFVTDDGKVPSDAPFQQGANNGAGTKISNGANGGQVVNKNTNTNGGKVTNGANGGQVVNQNTNTNGGKVTNGANGGQVVNKNANTNTNTNTKVTNGANGGQVVNSKATNNNNGGGNVTNGANGGKVTTTKANANAPAAGAANAKVASNKDDNRGRN